MLVYPCLSPVALMSVPPCSISTLQGYSGRFRVCRLLQVTKGLRGLLVVKDKKVRWKDIKAQRIMKIKRFVAEVRINVDYVFHIGCGLHLCFVRTWHNTMM